MSEPNDEHPTESECVVCKQNLLWGFWLFVRFSLGFVSTVMNVFSVSFFLLFMLFLLSLSLYLLRSRRHFFAIFSLYLCVFYFIFDSLFQRFVFLLLYDFTALLDGSRFGVRSLLCVLTLSVHCLLL